MRQKPSLSFKFAETCKRRVSAVAFRVGGGGRPLRRAAAAKPQNESSNSKSPVEFNKKLRLRDFSVCIWRRRLTHPLACRIRRAVPPPSILHRWYLPSRDTPASNSGGLCLTAGRSTFVTRCSVKFTSGKLTFEETTPVSRRGSNSSAHSVSILFFPVRRDEQPLDVFTSTPTQLKQSRQGGKQRLLTSATGRR